MVGRPQRLAILYSQQPTISEFFPFMYIECMLVYVLYIYATLTIDPEMDPIIKMVHIKISWVGPVWWLCNQGPAYRMPEVVSLQLGESQKINGTMGGRWTYFHKLTSLHLVLQRSILDSASYWVKLSKRLSGLTRWMTELIFLIFNVLITKLKTNK